MNNYDLTPRNRNKTLLIVEGNHEKNILFWLIMKCFSEINILSDNIWIYGTNIYILYEDICKEYGNDWASEQVDIDLPFVISKKVMPDDLRYGVDFSNIIMVFDYERHDPNFSKQKILDMQMTFQDETDMGKLYINYPMIESYRHILSIPDLEYDFRKIPVSSSSGSLYKSLVREKSVLNKLFELPHRLDDLLKKEYDINDDEVRKACCDEILGIDDKNSLFESITNILKEIIEDEKRIKLTYQLQNWILKLNYIDENVTYYDYVRSILKYLVVRNIRKADYIVNGYGSKDDVQDEECFSRLNLISVLGKQNDASDNGYIWVLNTSVLFIADYNFMLISD